ncbi:MAG: hypothetical protein GY758_33650 [Fuerstiella sp.]|nr:hypothetical protein [Fuerstiella sp.]MCP4505818.1 hypothetical protein [Fuerstiella sp.]
MRLTLRTLLAYLDDRLPSSNARELGQKLASSPLATELAERIREVVRRRRLADDAVRQKTIDANLIAEYLDDQLTPELVALIEKEILASDHCLAEVAATHQILGLLSDPVEIESGLKERLYRMDPSAVAADENGAQLSTSAEDWQPLAPQVEAGPRSPMILLAIMVLGWLGLLATDVDLFSSRPPKAVVFSVREPEPVVAGEPEAERVPIAQTVPQAQVADETIEPVTAAQPAMSTEDGAADSVTNADTTDAVVALQQTSETTATPLPTPAPVDRSDPPPVANDSRPEQQQPVVRDERLRLTDSYAMTVVSGPDDLPWRWAAALGDGEALDWDSVLRTRIVGIAEPYSAVVENQHGGWSAVMRGSSLFAALDAESTGISLFDGGMVLQRGVLAGQEGAPIVVGVGGRKLLFSLPDEGQRIGVRAVPLMNTTEPTEVVDAGAGGQEHSTLLPVGNPCMVLIFAANGDVVVRLDDAEDLLTIRRGSVLQWNTNADTLPEASAATTAIMPDWVIEPSGPQSDATKSLLSKLATGLQKNESVTSAAVSLSEDRNPQIAAYAMKLPVLLRQVDELGTMLMQSESQVVRRESIMGLEQILYQVPRGADRIREVLETRLPEKNLADAMRLLEGITRTSAEQRDVSEWLVATLESKRVALRELAIYNLERITGDDQGFFAGDTSGRVAAIRRWQRVLSRNNGRLVLPAE